VTSPVDIPTDATPIDGVATGDPLSALRVKAMILISFPKA